MFPYGELVEVLAAGESMDEYGNTVESWDSPAVVDSDPSAAVEPRPLGESTVDARNSVVSGFTLYCKAGLNVTSVNRVRVRGEVFAVDGDPAIWRSPFSGWAPGVVVQARRVDG